MTSGLDALCISGDIENHWQKTESGDAEQVFFPTDQGRRTLAAINACSPDQIIRALAATPPDAGGKITEARRMYEKVGFIDVGDLQEDPAIFGTELMTMEYVWKRPTSGGPGPVSESVSVEKASKGVNETVPSVM